MSLRITEGPDGEDREEMYRKLQKIRAKYEDKLEFEKRYWSRAWVQTKKHGESFLTWLSYELKRIWKNGGQDVVLFGALYGLTWLMAPVALPAVAAVAPMVILKIVYSNFGME